MLEPIIYTKNYGRVRVILKELLDKRNITRNNLARSINVRFEVIDRWYNGNIEKIDLDIIARICFVLNCSIPDILEYSPEEKKV